MNALVPFTGGGGSSAPTTTADNLRSVDYVEIILGLCQGPIAGLVNGTTSFYVGSTQFTADSGTPNFPSLFLEQNAGETPGEPITPVIGGLMATNTFPDAISLNAGKVSSQVTGGGDADAIVLGFNIQTLYSNGTIAQQQGIPGSPRVNAMLPGTLSLAINVTNGSGTILNPFPNNFNVTARTLSDEPTEVTIPVSGPGPYTITVQMLTVQSATTSTQAFIQWVNWTEVISGTTGWSRSDTIQQQLYPTVPIVRTTQQAPQRQNETYGVDRLSVRIDINELILSDSGGTHNTTVGILIEYKATSDTTWITVNKGTQYIYGLTTNSVDVQQFNWAVSPPLRDTTWDVRVTQITVPGPNQTINCSWESLEEIISGPMVFDGVATVHIWGKGTTNLTSIPNLWGEYDLLLMKLPGNYNPQTNLYTGTFDGTTPQFAWCNNPAWCLYDLATNSTYGVATFWADIDIDIYDVYAAGQWCDVLVPDGSGGLQRRYTMNTVISQPRGAMDQLRYMAGVFDGLLLDDLSGNLRLLFDQPSSPIAIFTPENTVDTGNGSFTYTYTDSTIRYNYVTVSFNDPDLNYQINTRVIWDQTNINLYGKIPLNFAAVGCTNGHEAVRRAAKKLISATTECEIVAFTTNRLGLAIQPLSVIMISDPDMGRGLTGRIQSLSIDRTIVYLRDPLYLSLGVEYIFNVNMPNPSYPAEGTDAIMVVSIPFFASDNGGTLALALESALPDAVDFRSNFSVSSVGNEVGVPKLYRVMRVEETDGNPDMLAIECCEINPAKQDLSDNAEDVKGLTFLNYSTQLPPPSAIQINTTIFSPSGLQSYANMTITWTAPNDPRVTNYNVQYRVTGTTVWEVTSGTNSTCRLDVFDIPNGTYDVQVQALGIGGLSSIWTQSFNNAAGLDIAPPNVQNFTLGLTGSHLTASWLAVPVTNLAFYCIRFSPFIDGTATWENSGFLMEQILTTSVSFPYVQGTYFIKAITTSSKESADAAFADTNSLGPADVTIYDLEQSPGWAGNQFPTSTFIVDYAGKLRLKPGGVSEQPQFLASATYFWDSQDFGVPLPFTVTLAMKSGVDNLSGTMADWDYLANLPTLDGETIDLATDAYAEASIQLSQDGTTFGDPAALSFVNNPNNAGFINGQYTARKFRFIIFLFKTTGKFDPWVSQCAFRLSSTARQETVAAAVAPSTGLTVAFNQPFSMSPALQITIKNGSAGDYYQFFAESNTGFSIGFFNVTNTAVSRIFDWTASGN